MPLHKRLRLLYPRDFLRSSEWLIVMEVWRRDMTAVSLSKQPNFYNNEKKRKLAVGL